ncbi:hypothetical protein AQUCO_03500109v1 [Aquilegia coerulea]|uniref:Pectinesterase n=1 Tax=Aquilegia coerulea TaxID=218851 RepID=A0A2G5CW64_AQUCA|nr:hypothetical protein AQUCO_03500109v1 [Aquilegia coerulea]
MIGKVAVGGISLILVVGVIIGVVATMSRSGGSDNPSSHNNAAGLSTGMKAVEALCAPTDFKDVCMKTLAPIAQKDNNASPKDLVHATFEATVQEVKKALNKTNSLGNGNSPYDQLSMDDCKELIEYAVYDLNKAISKIAKSEMHTLGDLAHDLNNWLSAVVAYQSSCLDDLQNPELKKGMEDGFLNTTQLTYNALGIVNEISKLLSKINITIPSNLNTNSRRLLNTEVDQDGFPEWFSAPDRKLLAATNNQLTPNAVVAQDGSGQFKTISAAIAAVPQNHPGRHIIYVKAGIYKETVTVPFKTINVLMYGDGPRKTIVTGDKNFQFNKLTTQDTATFSAVGDGFIAKSMAFQNTAGAKGHQAVALRVQSDMSAFYNCRIDGYQDTLYYQAKRSFYRNCVISGTVDFIFGKGTALIQNSKIIVRMGDPGQYNTVTADGRLNPLEHTGVVFQNCNIVPDAKLNPQRLTVKSYLGRPWKPYARTMFMQSEIGDVISPEGWRIWDGANYQDTCELREYANRGPGANTSGRVKWRGFAVVTDRNVAQQYTAGPLMDGARWIPATGGPVILGLSP